ncbi:hypothetical protein PQR33_14845 [Paraburkholderia sediminicola]|uniref:hypothetical protein n=1 Tax=Paraburkholderia sediminicola TaxID=458836 RepID=UPI0038B9A814
MTKPRRAFGAGPGFQIGWQERLTSLNAGPATYGRRTSDRCNVASIVETYGPFVKDQIDHQEKQAARYVARKEESKANAAQSRAAMFRQLLADLISHEQTPKSDIAIDPLRLSPSDIEDLPDELLAELSLNESDKKEFLIIDIIDEVGGIASLDRILVSLYRRTSEVEKRAKMVSRLYRMTTKGLIHAHPDKKGVYSTKPVETTGQLDFEGTRGDMPEEGSDLV